MMALFTKFWRREDPNGKTAPATQKVPGLLHPVPPKELLNTVRRQRLMTTIWQRTSLSRVQFDALYRAPLERYAVLVQQFPASETHHHSYLGGMLDHGLEIVAYALQMRQSHLLPIGASPEDQAAQSGAWTAAIAYAALLHDLGKIAVDLHVEHQTGEIWHPWHGPLNQPYRFRYHQDRTYRLHGAATGLLYLQVLDAPILDWLSGFPALWSALLHVLAGQYEHGGVIGELVQQADQASVAHELGGNPNRVRTAPKHALQRKLLEGLRFLLKAELKLNQPQASDGWLTHDALWLVSKTVCDKLRAHLLAQGTEGVPERNTAVFNVLQEHGMVQATADGKAIWRATIVAEDGWTQTFTLLKLSPSLIWDNIAERPDAFKGLVKVEVESAPPADESERPLSTLAPVPREASTTEHSREFTAPERDAVVSALSLLDSIGASAIETSNPAEGTADVLPPPDISARVDLLPASTMPAGDPGEKFVRWLKQSVQVRRIKINDSKALVHTVAGTAFLVTPGLFQRYAHEHPGTIPATRRKSAAEWEHLQKHFERLGLHQKQRNGLNIWTCEISGPRKTRSLHGYLLTDGHTLFDTIPFDNPYLKVIGKPLPQVDGPEAASPGARENPA